MAQSNLIKIRRTSTAASDTMAWGELYLSDGSGAGLGSDEVFIGNYNGSTVLAFEVGAQKNVAAQDNENSFETITIDNTDVEYTWAGTDGSVIADNTTDTLTLVGGANITLDYDAALDAIRVTASGGGTGDVSSSGSGWAINEIVVYSDSSGDLITTSNVLLTDLYAYGTINCPNGTDPVAGAHGDTLSFTDGTDITITGNATGDTIEIAYTGNATPDQNLFSTISGDTGSFSADGITNTLSVVGAGVLSTAVTDAVGTTTVTISTTAEANVDAFGVVTGDSGTASADGDGDTIAITGATGITTTATAGAAAALSIDLDDTAVTPGSYGDAATVPTLTVDQQGRLTAAGETAIQITESQITDGTILARVGGNETITGDWDFSSGTIVVGTPTLDGHAATKSYVDSVAQGLDVKDSVRAASVGGNLTLSGTQTVDGVALIADDRILVKDQTVPNQNGIYVVAAGAWSRSQDADTWAELVSAFVFVEEGTANSDTGWNCIVDAGGTLGTTDVDWTQFSGAGTYTAGAGLNLNGGEFAVYGGTAGQVLVSQGVAADAAWGALDVADADAITGLLPASHGGTGLAAQAANTMLIGSAGDTMGVVAAPGGEGYMLVANASSVPTWSNTIDGGEF